MDLQEIYQPGQQPFPLTYVNDIGEAIIHVNRDYCIWSYKNANMIQKTERVFAYELYYQFRLLMNKNKSYLNIRFDGEIGKQRHERVDGCGLTFSNFNTNQIHFSPDLVIHKNQNNSDVKNQKAVIEIKTKDIGHDELIRTIVKLTHYIRVFNFQYAIFITVNTEFNEIVTKLNRSLHNAKDLDCNEKFNRIIVMNYIDGKLTVDTLSNILVGVNNSFNYITK